MSNGHVTSIVAAECSAAVQQRGRDYQKYGCVSIESVNDKAVTGVVVGAVPYEVRITLGNHLDLFCDCPAFQRGVCKHIFALAIEIDSRGVLSKSLPGGAGADDKESRPKWQRVVEAVIERTSDASKTPDAPPLLARRSRWDVEVVRMHANQYVYGPDADVYLFELSFFRTLLRADGSEGARTPARWDPTMSYATMPEAIAEARAQLHAIGERPWERKDSANMLRVAAAALPNVFALANLGVIVRVVEGDDRSPPLSWDPYGWQPELSVRRSPDEEGAIVVSARAVRSDDVLAFDEPARFTAPGDLIVAQDRALTMRLNADDAWTSTLIQHGALHVPAESAGEVLDLLARTPGPGASTFDGFETRLVQPVALLTLTFPRESSAQGHVTYLYDDRIVEPSDGDILSIDAAGLVTQRDRTAEARHEAALLEAGAQQDTSQRMAHSVAVPVEGLPETLGKIIAAGWRVEVGGRAVRTGGKLDAVGIRSDVNWFEIEGGAQFDEAHLPIPRILKAIRAGTQIVELDDGTSAILPQSWLTGLRDLAKLGDGATHNDAMRVPRGQALLLDSVLRDVTEARGASVEVDTDFANIRENIENLGNVTRRPAPAGFEGTLRAYQEEGLGWLDFLVKSGLGGCLADDMGLGKTVQVLAHLLYRKDSPDRRGPFLVVAPRSVIWNWHAEAALFTPALRTVVYHGPDRKAVLKDLDQLDILVTTYGTLRRDIEELETMVFDHVVLDEAQAIKNAGSQSARAVRRLNSPHRLALSGTPIENRLGDLTSLFAFLSPGLLGSEDKLYQWIGGTRAEPDAKGLAQLQSALRPVVLRRTKEQVLTDLPPKTEQILRCELPVPQRKAYKQILNHYRSTLLARIEKTGLASSKIHVLEALLRLRQAACHPALIDEQHAEMATAKFDVMLPMIDSIVAEGHKALIFSQFTKYLGLLRKRLDESEIKYAYLDGRTRKREERIAEFQDDPDTSLFLISLKAGGTGLNLTAADYVFLLDPWWNPATEAQAVDRAHRIGQTSSVLVYRLIGAETIEERVLELQDRKRGLAQSVLGGLADAPLRSLDVSDLKTLLS